MNYILEAFKVFPIILIITTIVYIIICKVKNIKIKGAKKVKVIAEFTLVGFFVMFIYVTQIMSFGNGMGEIGFNLKPLHPFYIAAKYGSVNAGMVNQILLNVLMVVPLGFLLPVVFPNKFRNYLSILVVSFGLTFITEMIQLLMGRAADIDDIIANTMGGLLGFALYIFLYGICHIVKGKKYKMSFRLNNYILKSIYSVILLVLIFTPFMIVNILDSKSEFGHVYYGHLQPAEVKINGDISSEETKAIVYKIFNDETQEQVGERILKKSGFKDYTFEKEDYGTLCYFEGKSKSIFIHPYNTWSVSYNYGVSDNVNVDNIPSEIEAFELAKKYLNDFDINVNDLQYNGISADYRDDYLNLIFEPIESVNKEIKIVGDVTVTIGEEGKLLEIYDRRVTARYYKEVETISPLKSLDVASDVGVGQWSGVSYINEIIPSQYLQEDTGYLIPTWKIQGKLVGENGDEIDWSPEIEAIK